MDGCRFIGFDLATGLAELEHEVQTLRGPDALDRIWLVAPAEEQSDSVTTNGLHGFPWADVCGCVITRATESDALEDFRHPGVNLVGAEVSVVSAESVEPSDEALAASAVEAWWIAFLATAVKME